MKHNTYIQKDYFIEEPVSFDKYSNREFLSYCLGGTLYMPATKDFHEIISKKTISGMTSMVICFEDAIDISQLPLAEENAKICFDKIGNEISQKDIPLIFIRVRSVQQFSKISSIINSKNKNLISGFVFPKFSSENGEEYYSILQELSKTHNEIFYGMPILEGSNIAYKETRFDELIEVRKILLKYKDFVLNVRVGATDLSSFFGVRRGIDYSIYDILPVADCLLDIINCFSRDNDFVVSGPVWEYFLASRNKGFNEDVDFGLQSSILKRKRLVDEAIDGLLREVILDKANGFVGKTVIHPTHIKFINAMLSVTLEEYEDASQILNTSGGVIKSGKSNKMNEINPHRTWANKIINRGKAYGVIEDEMKFIKEIAKLD
ncbi:MAG: HpcH/HpaI aldolase/citrate lyase family protein [Anaerovoracaceae bacterium]